jgi:transient receptor potential cation channel subfamily A protein 1
LIIDYFSFKIIKGLLKHEVTRVLLDKKWRLIPRFVYYFNLLFYLTFLSLLSLYSLELASYGKNGNANNTNQTFTNMTNSFKYKLSFGGDLRVVSMLLFIILMLNLIKEIAFLFYDGLSYLTKTQNVVEFITYGMSMVSLLSDDVRIKSDYGSLAIVFAFILFPLYMQKLKLIGIYVVAFLRTLTNSAKFFPVFLIIYIGFIFGFKIRSNFGVTYFNSTSFSMIRTITMVVGEFDSSKMGLYEDSIPNFIIYVLFITLMCIILINLFVGIAVGEIKTVLDEADIQVF